MNTGIQYVCLMAPAAFSLASVAPNAAQKCLIVGGVLLVGYMGYMVGVSDGHREMQRPAEGEKP